MSEPVPFRLQYPAELPVSARRDELLEVIAANQVVVVAGETGSGKSTQLPKLCLELGRGVDGRIAHTQPRRIAARAVAERVAEELGVPLGGVVGYAVRFTDHVGPDTRLKVMTDGILLNELHRDRELRAYDTIIVDEAHERSLNIDFLLGYLAELLPRRPDLKVLVTSATIDTERFAAHFGGAPVVEVTGRTYPVEVRYRPVDEDDDLVASVGHAVREVCREGPGDVLVFASGEREIRDLADGIDGLRLPATEVIPLFARLSAAEQHRVFAPHAGRRVVIATNIAETSLTVPGIHYVVDPGTARISRYNKRTKVQRLPIEDVSRASADQRAGRCGRIAPGVCIRLYSEDDYLSRPEFTEPEILRTNLASVVLQMLAVDLGDIESFPFVEAPDRRNVADGLALLEDLGAIRITGEHRRLTRLGRRMARLPLDPTLARMVLEAERNRCVHEVMVIAAALSIQDPRERPLGQEQAAAERHARFRVAGSDFLGYLALWDHLRERQAELSSSRFRRECRDDFLHFVRVREWQDVYTQIRQVVRSLKIPIDHEPADADAIHRSLLAGLVGNVGSRDDRDRDRDRDRRDRPGRRGPDRGREIAEYVGPRGARFALGRGSVVARRPPEWVVAAELVETDRMWARIAAAVRPEWIEHAAAHLITRSYTDPAWNADRGAAQVVERVHLRSLVLVDGRRVQLSRIDPGLARQLFVTHALVRGEWDRGHAFVAHNAAVVEEVRSLEDRARRRDILVDEDVVFDFFDVRIPATVTDVRSFDRWWQDVVGDQPGLLDLSVDDLVRHDAGAIDADAFPATVGGDGAIPVPVGVDYAFAPGRASDGVTFEIPLAGLNRTDADAYEWLVPGLRPELVLHLVKALPKPVRKLLVPAPDRAAEALSRVGPDDGPVRVALAAELSRMAGTTIDPDVWDDVELPPHLRPRFRVVTAGESLGEGSDLGELRRRLLPALRARVVAGTPGLECDGLTDWTIGSLPRIVEVDVDGLPVRGFPAVVDLPSGVGVRILASEAQQRALHWNGVRRLLADRLGKPARVLQRRLDPRVLLDLTDAPHGSVTAAVDDARDAVLDQHLLAVGLPFDRERWDVLVATVEQTWVDELAGVVTTLSEIVTLHRGLAARLTTPAPPEWDRSLDDMVDQLGRLVYPGFVVGVGAGRVGEVPRYLHAVEARLDRLRQDVAGDRRKLVVVADLEAELTALVAAHGWTAGLDDVRWMIEEFRVQQFAQTVGAAVPVSEKRIRQRLNELR